MARAKKTNLTPVQAQSVILTPQDAKAAGDFIMSEVGPVFDDVFEELIYPYPGQTTKTQTYTDHDRDYFSRPNKCRYRKNGLSTNRRVAYRLAHIAAAIRATPKGTKYDIRKLARAAAIAYPV